MYMYFVFICRYVFVLRLRYISVDFLWQTQNMLTICLYKISILNFAVFSKNFSSVYAYANQIYRFPWSVSYANQIYRSPWSVSCKSNLPFPLISIMQCALNESKNRKLIVWERCSSWTCLFVLDCCLQHVRSSQLSRPWCEFWNFIKGPFNFVLCGDITFLRHPLPPLSLSITNLGCPLPPPPVTSFLSNPISVCWPSFMTNNLQFKRYFQNLLYLVY